MPFTSTLDCAVLRSMRVASTTPVVATRPLTSMRSPTARPSRLRGEMLSSKDVCVLTWTVRPSTTSREFGEIDALHRTFDFVVEDHARRRAVDAVLVDATFDTHDLADAQVGFGAGAVVERDGGARGDVVDAIDVHAAEARDGAGGRDDAAAIDARGDAARTAPPPQAATRIATPTVVQRLIVTRACIIIVLRPSVPELQKPPRPTAGWQPASLRPVAPRARSAIRRSVRGTPGLRAP